MISGDAHCPVGVYKEYMRRRPADCLSLESRFYLRPVKHFETSDTWFSREPLGKNTLCNFGKRMASQANITTTRKSNHSARKTAIELLLHENVPPTNVMQITGHKNVQSLNSYATMSLAQQQSVSHIISKQTNGTSSSSIKTPNHDWSDDDTYEAIDVDMSGMLMPLGDISNTAYQRTSIMSAPEAQPSIPSFDTDTFLHGDKEFTLSSPGPMSFLNGATINGSITINIHKH